MSDKTGCPLDCFDACRIVVEEGKLKGDKEERFTHGFLCPHLNHYLEYPLITQPRYRGEPLSIEAALEKLGETLKACEPSEVLHFRSGGNMGLMQQVTDHFFASYGATLTRGSLCDGAGGAGIVAGRGSNKILPLEQIEHAEVVVFWGRNPHVSSSHMLPLIKGKQVIVIDPVRTKIADAADLFVQIKPQGDLYLAMLLARFVMIEGFEDKAFLEAHASEHEAYFDFTQTLRVKASLDAAGITLGQMGDILHMLKGKKTVFAVGVGIQKHRYGDETMRAIDGLAAILGLFGKAGCGVAYLGNSGEGITGLFNTHAKKRIPKATANFGNYRCVFIQNANPLSQMPDTQRVKRELEQVETVVYFGLYENESSEAADLVIPACTFLHKNDWRSAYGNDVLLHIPKIAEPESGISEYALARHLCDAFDIDLKSEAEYMAHFGSFAEERSGYTGVKGRQRIPYADGFDTDEGAFVFLDELLFSCDVEAGYYLVTAKSPRSLNSQFARESKVYLPSAMGFAEGERVRIRSAVGSVELEVAIDERLREDCVLIYSGTPGVNNLTPSLLSYEGENAVYQDGKIEVEKC